jgi:iron complex transport system ATP-binding protein
LNTEVKLQKLTVGYGGVPLIREIEVEIRKGEILTLIGPNGSGKSTILKTIIGQLERISGHVLLPGKKMRSVHIGSIEAAPGNQLGSGSVLEDTAAPGNRLRSDAADAGAFASESVPQLVSAGTLTGAERSRIMAALLTKRPSAEQMTCHDVVAMGRYPYTGRLGILSSEDEKKVEEALFTVHASKIGPRLFSEISDGQKQRVLLARAICQEPDILILDEPTSYLDLRHKLALLSVLKDLAKTKQITVILSLHEIDLAQKISDHVLAVKGEYVFGYGTPQELFREDTIRTLYSLDEGSYDPLFGSVELRPPDGEAEIFVLSSGGRGIPVYRQLQKEGLAFCAGILYTNDMDYALARRLAAEVITEKPFCRIQKETFEKAASRLQSCRRVIDAGFDEGEYNEPMKALVRLAKERGILEKGV